MNRIYFALLFILVHPKLFAFSDGELVFESDKKFTNIAISKENRIFLSYPTLSKGENIYGSLYELVEGELKLFPDMIWNTNESNNSEQQFVCISDVYIDQQNFLWVLDAANPFKEGIVKSGVKLHKFDLEFNRIIKTYTFAAKGLFGSRTSKVVLPNSYLNKVRIDSRRNIAYLSDSEKGAIIVVNLNTGAYELVRCLASSKSVKGAKVEHIFNGKSSKEPVHVNALEISDDFDWIFFSAQTGKSIYKIPTNKLRNKNLKSDVMARYVEKVADAPYTTSLFHYKGSLYYGGVQNNSFNVLTKSGKNIEISKNSKNQWISDFAMDQDEKIYYVVSSMNKDYASRPGSRIYSSNIRIHSGEPLGIDWSYFADSYSIAPIGQDATVFVGDRVFAHFQFSDIFNDFKVKNRSISSEKTDGILVRIQNIARQKPKRIILAAGLNDLMDNTATSDVISNFEQIAGFIKELSPATSIYVLNVLPINMKGAAISAYSMRNKVETILDLNQLLMEFCDNYNITYIDVHSQFTEESTNQLNMKFSNDGVNLNKKGNQKLLGILRGQLK